MRYDGYPRLKTIERKRLPDVLMLIFFVGVGSIALMQLVLILTGQQEFLHLLRQAVTAYAPSA